MPAPPSALSPLPLVYDDGYDISLWGIEKLHPFDTAKYGRVHQHLVDRTGIDPARFATPRPASDEELLRVHTRRYLDSLALPATIAMITELPLLRYLPGPLLHRRIVEPTRLATGGTVEAAHLALRCGWAVNLAGGYHHAHAAYGGGFCFFADIPLAIRLLRDTRPGLRVLIVDLDAHQGDGSASLLGEDEDVFILDIYNDRAFPQDQSAKKNVAMDIPLTPGITDGPYLAIVERALPTAIDRGRPHLIIYNAGTDILAGDPLGGMGVTDWGVVQRDELVFREARRRGIPVVMLLSGGYTKSSAPVIGRSLENLMCGVLGLHLP